MKRGWSLHRRKESTSDRGSERSAPQDSEKVSIKKSDSQRIPDQFVQAFVSKRMIKKKTYPY